MMAKKGHKSTKAERDAGKANLMAYLEKNPFPAMKHGLYSKIDLSCIDGRTQMGKSIQALKGQLREFVGNGTPASEILIERIVFKTIKLSLYEYRGLSQDSKEATDVYLRMSNSLRSDLLALQQMGGKKKPIDLQDYIEATYGNKDESNFS